jgi:hypothetical protein
MEDTAVIEYAESTTVTLEWTLRGLKNIFDSRYHASYRLEPLCF